MANLCAHHHLQHHTYLAPASRFSNSSFGVLEESTCRSCRKRQAHYAHVHWAWECINNPIANHTHISILIHDLIFFPLHGFFVDFFAAWKHGTWCTTWKHSHAPRAFHATSPHESMLVMYAYVARHINNCAPTLRQKKSWSLHAYTCACIPICNTR